MQSAGAGSPYLIWIIWALGGILFISIIHYLWTVYNRLVNLETIKDKLAYALEAALRRRKNLLPALSQHVTDYIKSEQDKQKLITLFQQFTHWPGSIDLDEKNLPKWLWLLPWVSLIKTVNFPPTVGADLIHSLMEDIKNIENQVGAARAALGDAIIEYNKYRRLFPVILVAQLFHFRELDAKKIFSDIDKQVSPS